MGKRKIQKDPTDFLRQLYRTGNLVHHIRSKSFSTQSGAILNSAALSTLDVIDMNPGATSSEISRKMGISKSAVSQMITKLEKQELLERRTGENKKEFYPYLTRKGMTCTEDYRELRNQFYKGAGEYLSAFDSDQRQTILEFLTGMNDYFDDFDSEYL